MKTFLAWAVANLEVVAVIILAPFIWKFVASHPVGSLSDFSMWGKVLFMSFLVAVGGGCAWSKGFLGDALCLPLTAFGLVALIAAAGIPSDAGLTQLCIAGGFGLVIGIVVAVFAVSNFYEVVSLRWLYVNSNAAKFEESALYGFGRFCLGFHLGAYAYILML